MPSRSEAYTRPLFFGLLSGLLLYWGWLLSAGAWRQTGEEGPDIGGLARYLLGVVLLLASLWGVAHLNYRLAFRRWLVRQETPFAYWTVQVVLAWLLFEGLQVRTDYDPEFVDENLLVMSILMVFIGVYSYGAEAFRARREQMELVQQKTEAELTALKAQMNPHFLFNALNTIYNEAQRADNEEVADLIQQLSGLMRFTLQESGQPFTSVENELQFLEKYLALQRARLPQSPRLRLSTVLDWDGQPAQIPPLLLIPFVENAFQYGISLTQSSYIDLDIIVENRELRMAIQNSRPSVSTRPGMGTGIANARQRLALTYPGRHELHIRPTNDTFRVELTINL